jgi:hypothetical protein
MRTFVGQLQYRRTTDIAPRSGDQRDLPFKLAHAPISPTMFEAEPASRVTHAAQCFRTVRRPLPFGANEGAETGMMVPLIGDFDRLSSAIRARVRTISRRESGVF